MLSCPSALLFDAVKFLYCAKRPARASAADSDVADKGLQWNGAFATGFTTMTDSAASLSAKLPSHDRMFPTLSPAQVERIAAHGRRRAIQRGEMLVEAGAQGMPFFVVTAGALDIVRPFGATETLITTHGPGRFTGEVSMLS